MKYLERHNYMYICRSLLKHGHSNFSLTILEYCKPEQCLAREYYYQKKFNPEYNTAQDTIAPMSGLTHSDESKQKMSDAKIGEKNPMFGANRKGQENPMFGKKHSSETLSKISAAMIGNTNSHNQPNSTKIMVTDLKTKEPPKIYDSINAVSKALNIPNSSIRANLKSKSQKPYKDQYVFKKVD
jgi:group I intron endonuclease